MKNGILGLVCLFTFLITQSGTVSIAADKADVAQTVCLGFTSAVVFEMGMDARFSEMTVDDFRWKGRNTRRVSGQITLKAPEADWDPWHNYLCLYDPAKQNVAYIKLTESATGLDLVFFDDSDME